MINRRSFLFLTLAVLLSGGLAAAETTYDSKTLSSIIPKPAALGANWHPALPERWLTTTPEKITAVYEYRPEEEGQEKDSVAVDIFILKSASESAGMIAAFKRKAESTPGNVIQPAPQLPEGAYISQYGPEPRYGKRITFSKANLVITLSPSQHGMTVAKKINEALKAP